MAISNNTTGIRTGVCTSTTRPTAPYEGQHIYETNTDIEYVWNGSAWVVNYVSAASPAFTGTPTAPTATTGTNTTQLATTAFANAAGGLVFVKSQTFSNVAAVQINDCFNSTCDHYKVLLNLYGSQSGTATYARYRFVAGTTPTASGYIGKGMWTDINPNNFAFINSDASTDSGVLGPMGFIGAGEGSYDMEIHYPNVARPTRAQISGQGLYQNAYYVGTIGWTLQTGNTSFQGLYIYPMNFNINGDITIYGYRKA